MIIYKIYNNINGKIYVGMTRRCTTDKRISEHCYSSRRKNNSLINKAINKYGIDNFSISVIETCNTIDELKERESFWIKECNSCDRNIGYNIANGGQGCRVRRGYRLSEEHKKKLSESKIGNKCHLGKKHSNETKLVISQKNKGLRNNYTESKMIKVICLDNGFVYESIEEAARKNDAYPQNVRKVCIGERNSTNGLKFKYCYE